MPYCSLKPNPLSVLCPLQTWTQSWWLACRSGTSWGRSRTPCCWRSRIWHLCEPANHLALFCQMEMSLCSTTMSVWDHCSEQDSAMMDVTNILVSPLPLLVWPSNHHGESLPERICTLGCRVFSIVFVRLVYCNGKLFFLEDHVQYQSHVLLLCTKQNMSAWLHILNILENSDSWVWDEKKRHVAVAHIWAYPKDSF